MFAETARLARLLLLAGVLGCTACATGTEVKEAPLAQDRQKKLRMTLIGTWQHTHIVSDGSDREPVKEATITWTFEEDGTGVYSQEVPSVGQSNQRNFQWHLEGRNIVLENSRGGRTTYYRAETWSTAQMRWFNYTGSNDYILRRTSK